MITAPGSLIRKINELAEIVHGSFFVNFLMLQKELTGCVHCYKISLGLAQLQSLPKINLDNPFKAAAWA